MTYGNKASELDPSCDGFAWQSRRQHTCRALLLSIGHLVPQNKTGELEAWQKCYFPPPAGNGNATYYAAPQLIHWITSKVRAILAQPYPLISCLAGTSHSWDPAAALLCSSAHFKEQHRVQGIPACFATWTVDTAASHALPPPQSPTAVLVQASLSVPLQRHPRAVSMHCCHRCHLGSVACWLHLGIVCPAGSCGGLQALYLLSRPCPNHAMLRYDRKCYAMPCRAKPCYADLTRTFALQRAPWFPINPMLDCFMLCCLMLRCSMLCYEMLLYAMVSPAMLLLGGLLPCRELPGATPTLPGL